MGIGGEIGGVPNSRTKANAVTAAVRSTDRDGTDRVLYQRLRPGPGLSPEQVIANQRVRLCGAMIELVTERGYGRVTVRELSRLAGVSTRSFYACFANVEECFAATYARVMRDLFDPPDSRSADGDERLRECLGSIFARLAWDDKAARLVLIESLCSGPAVVDGVRCGSQTLRRFVRNEFAAPPCSVQIPDALAHGIGAALLRVARTQLLAARPVETTAVADGFTDWLLALRDARLGRMVSATESPVATAPSGPPRQAAEIGDDRRFLLAAVTKLSMSAGYSKLTIPAIRQAAGVSRRSFDDNFGGVDDCFLAAVESHVESATERAVRDSETAPSSERALVRLVLGLCREVARDPVLARLGLVDILQPGRPGLELRESIVGRWAALLRQAAPLSERPGGLAAEASAAAIVGAIAAEAGAGRLPRIRSAAPSLAFVGLAPAIGPAAAERAILAEL